MLDNSDFVDTDIPLEVSLPEKPAIPVCSKLCILNCQHGFVARTTRGRR